MSNRARITRGIEVGDDLRVTRHARVPELGPRILFFSGGTALRPLSRKLKRLTHNSIHLITPFDSGGSSATLREAFRMLSVGDLRNRLMALADETQRGNPQIYRLFGYRFPSDQPQDALRKRLTRMLNGDDTLVANVPEPLRRIVRTHLRAFADNMPDGFDLRGASVGNLMLAAGFLDNERDIDSVIYLFSKLVEVRGIVQPTVRDDLQLAATLEDGTEIVGQHLITGKAHPPITSPIRELKLVNTLDDPTPASCAIDDKVRKLILGAELIVYPVGSFYTSLIANLLPDGVTRAIHEAECPKVYVPNTGDDPEELGLDAAGRMRVLLEHLRRGVPDADPARLLTHVLVDGRLHGAWPASEGVQVLDAPLASSQTAGHLDAELLARALVSMC
jgi:CofD-related protein of GAK system